jgi:hypothetical protein
VDRAQGVVQQARPQIEQVVSKAQEKAQKITRRGPESSSSYAGPASMGTGGSPAPGV